MIDIHTGHQYDPWYMRMNPAGTVPTLQDGEKIIKDSEEIISYIDRKYPKGKLETHKLKHGIKASVILVFM